MEFPLTLEQVQALEPKVAKCRADEVSSWLDIGDWLTPKEHRGRCYHLRPPHPLPTVAYMVRAKFLSRWSAIRYLPAFLRASGADQTEAEQIVQNVASNFMPFMDTSDPLRDWHSLNRVQKEVIFEWLEWSMSSVKTEFIHHAEIFPEFGEAEDFFIAPATFNDLFWAEREINRYRAWLAIWKQKLDEEALQDAKRIPGSS